MKDVVVIGAGVAGLGSALSLARAEPDPDASNHILARSRASLKRRLDLEQP